MNPSRIVFVVGSLVLAACDAGAGTDGAARDLLARQARAQREQDTAICMEKLDRSADAVAHYRAAIAQDPFLKTSWSNLAAHALDEGRPDQALHLAGVAQFLDPAYEPARGILKDAADSLPPLDRRLALPGPECPPSGPAVGGAGSGGSGSELRPPDGGTAKGEETGAAAATKAGGSETGADRARACLERRVGWFGPTGERAVEPLTALAQLDLEEGRPESAALLLRIASQMGPVDPALYGTALDRAGDPCAAVERGAAPDPVRSRCEALRAGRGQVEKLLGAEIAGLGEPERTIARRRIEVLLVSGLTPAEAARRWTSERRRGVPALVDLGPLVTRIGPHWSVEPAEGDDTVRVLRRWPGDSVVLASLLDTAGARAEERVQRLLGPRKPGPVIWEPATISSTGSVSVRRASTSVDTDTGGRAEGVLWLVESPLAPGRALLLAGFPGGGGLGAEGAGQSAFEVARAGEDAVLVPERWRSAAALPASESELSLPLDRDREADEREAPWRTVALGASGLSMALPPGTVAANPSRNPLGGGALQGGLLWLRSRFVDREGKKVAIGDEMVAGSVDFVPIPAAEAPPGPKPPTPGPVRDPSAALLTTVDATALLGSETGASRVFLARYRPSSGRPFEWMVARLTYTDRILEIDLPVFEGSESLALYWIPSTVRTSRGAPPPAPVDLTGRLGISFLRPPPSEKREAFYKEGDLRSREFSMMVARGYYVSLNSNALDALPVRLTSREGGAVVVLQKLSPAGPGASEPASRLAAAIEEFVESEGYEATGAIEPTSYERASKQGAVRGATVTFRAAPDPSLKTGASRSPREGEEPDEGSAPIGPAAGQGWLLESRDGRTYVLVSICWGADQRRREEEVRLMASSLKLQARGPDAADAPKKERAAGAAALPRLAQAQGDRDQRDRLLVQPLDEIAQPALELVHAGSI